jgi:hypothetical protein
VCGELHKELLVIVALVILAVFSASERRDDRTLGEGHRGEAQTSLPAYDVVRIRKEYV